MASNQLMEPKEAAEALKDVLNQNREPMTVSDASAKSGLALRDAESGLKWLASEYRGHLSATESGEILYHFPGGFTKPWHHESWLSKAWTKTKRFFTGAGRFVARAWLTWAILFYTAMFSLLLLALALRSDSDRGSESAIGVVRVLLHIVLDALYWTFHPFSPFYIRETDAAWLGQRLNTNSTSSRSFYDKVNRFFFGPPKEHDPKAIERIVLMQIRSQKGRIGLLDVMRTTGLSREESEHLMCRFMLDYEGEVSVSDDGVLFWTFEKIRQTTDGSRQDGPPAEAWRTPLESPQLTGNTTGTDILIGALNGLNLLMSMVAISLGLTWDRFWQFVDGVPWDQMAPMDGSPLLLGWIPLFFSSYLFSFPFLRWMTHKKKVTEVDKQNGKRGLLKVVLEQLTTKGFTKGTLKKGWRDIAKASPSDEELTEVIAEFGGDIEVDDDGITRYRFRDLEAEVAALQKERAAASDKEKEVGEVVFSSLR